MSRVGKTTIGKKLAEDLKLNFFDTDLELEKKYGMKIADLYETKGEKKFRELEFNMLKSLSDKKNSIISTGGGIIENSDSFKFLKEQNTVIFLDCDFDILFDRIEKEKNEKKFYPKFLNPVQTAAEAKEKFARIYARRKKLYQAVADFSLDIENFSNDFYSDLIARLT